MSYNLKELQKDSIKVYPGMIVVWPYRNQEERASYFSDVATFNGAYCSNNGTLAYVKDGELWVTPFTRRAYEVIRDNFSEKHFYVPFSNGDYPKIEKKRWQELRDMQDRLSRADFLSDCISYSDQKGIGVLSDDVLAKCFEIPEGGLYYSHHYYGDGVFYPYLMGARCFDSTTPDILGKYNRNNGIVVFVYRDGRTFLVRGYKVMEVLEANGYKKGNLNVPLSNGEEIKNSALKMKWRNTEKFF